jgi:hypothetical protein
LVQDYTGANRETITNGLGVASTVGFDSLVGGTGQGEGNLIAGVSGSGVEVASFSVEAYSLEFTPSKIAVLGNSIHSIRPSNLIGIGNSNLGIDLASWRDTTGDFTPDEYTSRGPTANDSGDIDTGPNGFINSPVIKSAKQDGNQLTITYDLDAADSPSNSYRVEFFANDAPSIFGYGPGQTFIGADTVAPGTNKTVTLTVNGDYADKIMSSTTTAVDNTTNSGFGSTGEFSNNISIGSVTDDDADGVTTSEEQAAPNNGDGNDDGIPDSQQATVTSYKVLGTSTYATFVSTGCIENGKVESLDPSTLNAKDNGNSYPYGLTSFTLYCSRGETANINVDIILHSNEDSTKYTLRKLNTNNNTFSSINGASISQDTIAGNKVLKVSYQVTDGGELDIDGEVNGIIVDPVGLATTSTLVNTGIVAATAVIIGFILIAIASYTYIDYKRHKKPLISIEPELAKQYTYTHHLRVVTIPLFKYRLSIKLEKKPKNVTEGV